MNNLYILFFLLIIILILIICSIIIQDVCYRGGIKGGATTYEKMQEQMQRVDDLKQNIESLKKNIENRMYDNEINVVEYQRNNTEILQDLENDNAFDHYEVTTHQGNYKPGDQIDLETLQKLIRKGNVPTGNIVKKKGGKRILGGGKRVFGGGINEFMEAIADEVIKIIESNGRIPDDAISLEAFIQTIDFEKKPSSTFEFLSSEESYHENEYIGKIQVLLIKLLSKKIKYYKALNSSMIEHMNYKFIRDDLNKMKDLLYRYYHLISRLDTAPEIQSLDRILLNQPADVTDSLIEEYIKYYSLQQDNISNDSKFQSFKSIFVDKASDISKTLLPIVQNTIKAKSNPHNFYTDVIVNYIKTNKENNNDIIIYLVLLYVLNTKIPSSISSVLEIDDIIKPYYSWYSTKGTETETSAYIQQLLNDIINGNIIYDSEIIDEVRDIIELKTVKSIMESIADRQSAYEDDIVAFKRDADSSLFE